MKIKPEIDVFENAEFCDDDKTVCSFLADNDGKTFCSLFKEFLEASFLLNIDKCDQCKADYLKAKREEPTDSIIIDGYRFDCLKKRLYFEGKILATLICDEKDRLEFLKRFIEPSSATLSTHEGTFNDTGRVIATGMYIGEPGKMHIEIMIMVVE